MLYQIPGRAAVEVTLDTPKAIAERAENFIGINHAVAEGDMTKARELRNRLDELLGDPTSI